MIEAVNSSISTASVLRGNVEQVDATKSVAANPERTQQAAPLPQAPYVSPYIYVDANYHKAVLQIRDGDTGDVVNQFPSESALRAQSEHVSEQPQQAAPQQQAAPAPTQAPAPEPQQAAQAQVAAAALTSAASSGATTTTFSTTA